MRTPLVFVAGALFGVGLVLSGMTDPARVIGFLDFFEVWDPTLAFVMGGAVTSFGLGQLLLRKRHIRFCATDLPDTSSAPISPKQVTGSILFGIGWGLSGFCPGPALANLSRFQPEVLIFVPLMLIGMFLAQKAFRLDQ